MVPQSIINVPEICRQHGIQHAILSPGSRSAPLSLVFARHHGIQTQVIDDERTAAFVGFGRALESNTPVVLVCTSGSAGYNYAPAVAEAFFQQVPLVVLTADRPPEWIDQWDGQTIRQQNLYGEHVKSSYQFPVDTTHPDAQWQADRMISEAINLAQAEPKGPVHINIPLREPFYPTPDQNFTPSEGLKVIRRDTPQLRPSEIDQNLLAQEYMEAEKVLIIAGQASWSQPWRSGLMQIGRALDVPVVADIISNAQGLPTAIYHQDAWLPALQENTKEELQPDLLITLGKSVISKQLKLFLREYPPQAHWHLQAHTGPTPDPFQSLTRVIPTDPNRFLQEVSSQAKASSEQTAYLSLFRSLDRQAYKAQQGFHSGSSTTFNEFGAVNQLLQALPRLSDLHLANSMAVRYANFVGLGELGNEIRVFANRGTSGIDGSNSTQRGAYSGRLSVLLTGDMAFFYDRNAWWGAEPTAHMRIAVLNNHGGGIFRMIKGPRQLPELEYLFDTHQPLSAKNMAEEWGMTYRAVHNEHELAEALPDFVSELKGAQLLEIFTDMETNTEVFDRFKQQMRDTYGA
ncbi:MAG TPA: 2-succinyl-5-enolpyruvyl-6-hydroxy-3-cyclohexene-1-carboxylic-acid synthase [Cytophagales bacterium]|nr:2-succinyl-5-enolpyruvyl-6-hydroxy-3-cyclohexene-1-carboxylic-acid synthase [Cytophagales bacterium]